MFIKRPEREVTAVFPRKVSEIKMARSFLKGKTIERFPRELANRVFRKRFPHEIPKRAKPRDCSKRAFQQTHPRTLVGQLPLRDFQDKFPT